MTLAINRIPTLRNLINILIGLLICLAVNGQKITVRLILTDTKDSLYLKSDKISFDKQGNYCFIIDKGDQEYFVTNIDTIDGFNFIGSTFGNGGEINYTYSYSDPKEKQFYYKNAKGTKVFGKAIGKIEDYQTSNTNENIALVTSLNDSVYYYINGNLLLKKYKDPEKYYGVEDDWVSFSENGNTIYFLETDSINYLYVNGKIIDSSKFSFTQLVYIPVKVYHDSGTYFTTIPEHTLPRFRTNVYHFR